MLVGQALAGVVADHGHGVVAVAAAQPGGVFLAGDGVDEVRVDPQHDRLAEVTAGYAGGWDPSVAGGDQGPGPLADEGSGGLDTVEGHRVEFAQGAADGGRRRDRTEEVLGVAEGVDGAHRGAATGHHDGGVDDDPASVVVVGDVVVVQGVGQRLGQAGAVGGQPERGRAGVWDDVVAAGGDGQVLGPSGRVAHAKSAFRNGFDLA